VLVARGASFHMTDHFGQHAALDAAFSNSHGALEFFLHKEPDLTGESLLDGKTIPHVAALNSNRRTIETLLHAKIYGLNPNALDESGHTALDYARRRKDIANVLETFCSLIFGVGLTFKDIPETNSASDQRLY